jgi:hypothetical protein
MKKAKFVLTIDSTADSPKELKNSEYGKIPIGVIDRTRNGRVNHF